MDMTKFAIEATMIFSIVLVVSVIVTLLFNLIVHGYGVIDWETSFRISLILGVALPWIHRREKKQSGK